MRLESITPQTPPFSIFLELDRIPVPGEKWPEGFAGWPNVQAAHMHGMRNAAANAQPSPVSKSGRGFVMCGGGIYLPTAYVSCQILRKTGSKLPGQLFYLGDNEMDDFHRRLFAAMNVECVDATQYAEWGTLRNTDAKERGWLLKPFALRHTKYKSVAAFDADCYPVVKPEDLFNVTEYFKTGALFFADTPHHDLTEEKWRALGFPPQNCSSFESGQMWIDTKMHWRAIALTLWLNSHADFYYQWFWGDKETFCVAWRQCKELYAMPDVRGCIYEGQIIIHYGFGPNAAPVTVHRCRSKFSPIEGEVYHRLFWNTDQTARTPRPYFPNLPYEREAHTAFANYLRMSKEESCR